MITALIVSSEKAGLANLEAVFSENEVEVSVAESGLQAMSKMAESFFDIVVADENPAGMTGLELAGKVVLKHPMSNVAIVSSLSPQDFHETAEGLGILMQLPPEPGRAKAESLLAQLKNVLRLTGKVV